MGKKQQQGSKCILKISVAPPTLYTLNTWW